MSAEPTPVLHRDLSTQSQLGMLLAVAGNMMGYLSREPEEAENVPGARPLPGESRLAAEATLIKTCGKIDSILDDPRRWGIDFQLSLEKMFSEQNQRSKGIAEKQQAALEAQMAPHNRVRPTLFAMGDGTWVAFLGNPEDLSSGVMGSGISPLAALKSFDENFNGGINQFSEAQRNTLITAIQNEHNTESKPLDKSRTDGIGKTDQGGGELPGDSEPA